MEKEINIAELLKDAPKGTKLWSPLLGEVFLVEVSDTGYIYVNKPTQGGFNFYKDGRYMTSMADAECLLFPSKDHRTWEDFKPSWKPDHKVFEPFQEVLVHIGLLDGRIIWRAHIYSHYDEVKKLHITIDGDHFLDRDIESYEGNEDKIGKEVEE